VQVLAHAKINLSLEVLGRRTDGYHQVATVLHSIALADRLTVEPSDRLSLVCTPDVVPVEENLVMKAARLLQEASGARSGAAMFLEKRIPMASGLGGGSSDAAAALKALNELWDARLSVADLERLAAGLGSDVPFFVHGGCALAEGRGEQVTPMRPVDGWWVVLLFPSISMDRKTERLYGLLTDDDYTDGSATLVLADRVREGTTSPASMLGGHNAFERAALAAFAGLKEHRAALTEAGAPFVRLTGAGPALMTLVSSEGEARAIRDRLVADDREAYAASLVAPGQV
jgi:4-diphosphocytidyl-2-C-methyl-D-erythritol kinase